MIANVRNEDRGEVSDSGRHARFNAKMPMSIDKDMLLEVRKLLKH